MLAIQPDKDIFDNSVKKEYMDNPYLQKFFKNEALIKRNESESKDSENDSTDNIAFNFGDKNIEERPMPSNLRVSTMTAICSINMNIDLKLLFELIEITPESDGVKNYPYIQSCQFGNDNIKGISNKKPRKKRVNTKKTKRTYFQNQATLIVCISEISKVNLKIFRNGKIQMTGLKSKEEGMIACEKLLKVVNQLKIKDPKIIINDLEVNKEKSKMPATSLISNFSIVLINSDFFGGFKVKREKLYEILSKNNYFVSYEPDIYPGVNSKFYWNKDTINTDNNGKCKCTLPCDGKGSGEGNGNCKKITIATFQSGNIIITGARNNEQTMAAYNFINRIFREHYNQIVRLPNNDNDTDNELQSLTSRIEVIKINTKDIVNFEMRDILLEQCKK